MPGVINDESGRWVRFIDCLIIASSLLAAQLAYQPTGDWDVQYTVAVLVALIVFLFAGDANGLYRNWQGIPIRREVLRVGFTWAITVPFLLAVGFFTKHSAHYSRLVVMIWFGSAPFLMASYRVVVRLAQRRLRAQGVNLRRVAIAGGTVMGERLARRMTDSPWLGMKVVGFYDDRGLDRLHAISDEIGSMRGSLAELVEHTKAGEIDAVYIALPFKAESRINDILHELKDTTASVHMVADFFVFDLLRSRWTTFADIPVVSLHDTPFYGVDGWLKRAEDIILGSLILLLILVPMIVIAIGVKLSSRGPIFFKQRRYGLNGEVIEVLKFRSMRVMEDGAKVKQATKDDPRITKFGAFLRRTSLDEFPQFLHVITGKMSIVGPRPHAVAHNEEYRKRVEGYMLRHKVKPGITGWAQVNGWRGETDTLEKMEKRIEYDLEYIRNWGVWLDLRIIWKTIFGGFTGKNAY